MVGDALWQYYVQIPQSHANLPETPSTPNQPSHSLVQPQTILYRSEFIIQLGWENMSKERATIVAESKSARKVILEWIIIWRVAANLELTVRQLGGGVEGGGCPRPDCFGVSFWSSAEFSSLRMYKSPTYPMWRLFMGDFAPTNNYRRLRGSWSRRNVRMFMGCSTYW